MGPLEAAATLGKLFTCHVVLCSGYDSLGLLEAAATLGKLFTYHVVLCSGYDSVGLLEAAATLGKLFTCRAVLCSGCDSLGPLEAAATLGKLFTCHAVLCSGYDSLDSSDQGGAERSGRRPDLGECRSSRGDRVLEEPLCRPVGHHHTAGQAGRQAHHQSTAARQVILRRAIPQTLQPDQGWPHSLIHM